MVVLKVVLLLFFAATIQGCEKVLCNMYDVDCTTTASQNNWKEEVEGREGEWATSDPLKRAQKLNVETSELKSEFADMRIEGFINCEIQYLGLDESTMNWTMICPQIDAYTIFELEGSIGDLDVGGAGIATAIRKNLGFKFYTNYEDIEGNDGKTYMNIRDDYNVEYICEDNCNVSYDLQYYGDQEQTDKVNPYLNENFKLVEKLIGYKWLDGLMDTYVLENVKDYCKVDPKEEIFYTCN